MLTDARLLFIFHGLLSKESEDFPLTTINSVNSRSGAVQGELKVHASGNKTDIEGVDNFDPKEFADALRAEIARLKAAPRETQESSPSADGDVLDQIARLAQLQDAGVITAEEFEAKKAELLSRL